MHPRSQTSAQHSVPLLARFGPGKPSRSQRGGSSSGVGLGGCTERGARTGLAMVGDDAVLPEAGVGVNLLAGRRARRCVRVAVAHCVLPGQAAVHVQHGVVRGRA